VPPPGGGTVAGRPPWRGIPALPAYPEPCPPRAAPRAERLCEPLPPSAAPAPSGPGERPSSQEREGEKSISQPIVQPILLAQRYQRCGRAGAALVTRW